MGRLRLVHKCPGQPVCSRCCCCPGRAGAGGLCAAQGAQRLGRCCILLPVRLRHAAKARCCHYCSCGAGHNARAAWARARLLQRWHGLLRLPVARRVANSSSHAAGRLLPLLALPPLALALAISSANPLLVLVLLLVAIWQDQQLRALNLAAELGGCMVQCRRGRLAAACRAACRAGWGGTSRAAAAAAGTCRRQRAPLRQHLGHVWPGCHVNDIQRRAPRLRRNKQSAQGGCVRRGQGACASRRMHARAHAGLHALPPTLSRASVRAPALTSAATHAGCPAAAARCSGVAPSRLTAFMQERRPASASSSLTTARWPCVRSSRGSEGGELAALTQA